MVRPQAASDHIQLLSWSFGSRNSSLTPKSGDVLNPHNVLCSLEAPPWRGNTEQSPHKANPKFNSVLPSASSLLSQSRHILSSRKASPCWQTNAQGFSSVSLPRTLGKSCQWVTLPSWHPASFLGTSFTRSPRAPGSSSTARAEPDGTFFGSTSPNPWSLFFVPFFL